MKRIFLFIISAFILSSLAGVVLAPAARAATNDPCNTSDGKPGALDPYGNCIPSKNPAYKNAGGSGQDNAGSVKVATVEGGSCAALAGLTNESDRSRGQVISQDPNSVVKFFCSQRMDDPRNIIFVIIEQVANYLTGILVFFLAVVVAAAGVQISASGGNPQMVQSARKRLNYGIASIVLINTGRVVLDAVGITGGHFLGVDIKSNVTIVGDNNTLVQIISALFRYVNYTAAIVAIAFVIVGGIKMMTSAGNPQAVQGARKTLTYALIGLAISVSALLIIGVISNIFNG